jgi:hypothetical protein
MLLTRVCLSKFSSNIIVSGSLTILHSVVEGLSAERISKIIIIRGLVPREK